MTENLVDLHLHTTASDGSDSPAELVRRSLAAGLAIIAVTDHDSTEGMAEARDAAHGSGLEVISGIEVSTDVPLGEVHVLGYFVNREDAELQRILTTLRDSRRGRARGMVDKLAELGMPIEWERVKEIAGAGAVGRPHVAKAMVEKGYVASNSEAFDLYIGRNGPAYVERYKLTPVEAVDLILHAGGLAGLAHPIIPGVESPLGEEYSLDSLLGELAGAGLAAMECYYTGYTPEITASLLAKARRHKLIPTGGSDYHGSNLEGSVLGGVHVPMSAVEDLRARLNGRR